MRGVSISALVQPCGDSDKGRVRVKLNALGTLAGLALPPRCPGCGAVTGADHRFCADCWGALRFLAPPWCVRCHMPFAFDRGADAVCAACLAEPPRHTGIHAAVAYGDVARRVVLKLKYGGRMAYAETVARLIARTLPDDVELLVPVPLHRWRIWSRGYNQAGLIAQALGRRLDRPVALGALARVRATPVLRGMGPAQRRRAVAGAFALSAGADAVTGRKVALIDDIHTSGATANACTRLLLRAGARDVAIAAWARVIESHEN